ncbi:MAG: sigma-54 dependent transcriptional regulator [Candidatus Omnitrophota bacterium]
MSTILVVDDEKNVISSFVKILSQEDYRILTASNAEDGLALAQGSCVDLLIMDIKMPGMSGLEALSGFKALDAKLPIIIMTAYATTERAIEAMQLGAYDYVIKPFDVPRMKKLIEKALETSRLMKTEVDFKPRPEFKGDRIIGSSCRMQEIYKLIGQVAASDTTVFLRGESGTGKELVARAIYHHSHRKHKPFLVINSAAIPETLLESELFGYERGAFTDARERRIGKLEQCNGGTLFLDEIGDMPHAIQTKLLRVLENKSFERLGSNKTITVDVRLLTATNKDLEKLLKEGKFREDLYYRLNVVALRLPPLRERKEDIALLAEYFINRCNKELLKTGVKKLSSEALKTLQNYDWPGNVRELENVIKKALLLGKGHVILPEDVLVKEETAVKILDLKEQLQSLLSKTIGRAHASDSHSLYADVIEMTERTLIMEVLRQTQGNQSQAARFLGISRPTLKDKIEKLGIEMKTHIKEA